jgi:hypothetical protein
VPEGVLRTLLICHDGARLHQEGLARWLTSFSTLSGILVLREDRRTLLRRVRREVRRAGVLGFADVLAFRAYYQLLLAPRVRTWEARALRDLVLRYPPIPASTRVAHESSPNSASAERFVRDCAPDMTLALCKNLLAERIWGIPPLGTFVLHPGICPEYRNAHGCFWALANDDLENVGMTLLKIDRGVDTGPVFGYFRSAYDEVAESHAVIQSRVVLDNLDQIRSRLTEIALGRARPIDTDGRPSAAWGQPRLTRYLRWKRNAWRRRRAGDHPGVS